MGKVKCIILTLAMLTLNYQAKPQGGETASVGNEVFKLLNTLSNTGEVFFDGLKFAKKAIPSEDIRTMIEIFELIDRLACIGVDVDFYFSIFGDGGDLCLINIQYQAIRTNINVLIMKLYELVHHYTNKYGLDVEEKIKGALSGVLTDVSIFGVSLGTVFNSETKEEKNEVTVKSDSKGILMDIKKELEFLTKYMLEFNYTYERRSQALMSKEIKQYQQENYTIFSVQF